MKSFFARLACCGLGLSLNTPIGVAAEWKPVNTNAESNSTTKNQVDSGRSTQWSPIQSKSETSTKINRQVVWTPVEPAIAQDIEDNIDKEKPVKDASAKNQTIKTTIKQKSVAQADSSSSGGLRWPNGQLMSEEDQIYFRTAYSRGSMIQLGETTYPNIGFNALQRKPGTWVNLQIAAIDDSWQVAPSPCENGDFFDQCSDGLSQNFIRLWADKNFSFDLQWTIHSLSGEGAPFSFSTDNATFGSEDTGTAFGEGQSLGFKLSKNFGKTFGVSIGGDRLYHLDKTTDLSRNLYLMGTKITALNNSLEPPIVSLSLGLMSDVYNPLTNLGTVRYPKWMRGGNYPSIFSANFDDFLDDGHASSTAGVSSAFVCAEQSIFKLKSLSSADKNCIKDVFIGPVASIGIAPWPWLGFYAMYNSDINFGISFKPLKELNWQFGFELVAPIKGVNPGTDRHIEHAICPEDNDSFSACRTRIGFFTDLSF